MRCASLVHRQLAAQDPNDYMLGFGMLELISKYKKGGVLFLTLRYLVFIWSLYSVLAFVLYDVRFSVGYYGLSAATLNFTSKYDIL